MKEWDKTYWYEPFTVLELLKKVNELGKTCHDNRDMFKDTPFSRETSGKFKDLYPFVDREGIFKDTPFSRKNREQSKEPSSSGDNGEQFKEPSSSGDNGEQPKRCCLCGKIYG